MKYWHLLLLMMLLTISCKKGIDIPNFDEKAFQQDKKGCSGTRENMREELFNITSQLKGLSQEQIKATLGKPDQQELAERNQKYFVYFIEPSIDCPKNTSEEEPLTMFIRFSALNRSTEISFKNY